MLMRKKLDEEWKMLIVEAKNMGLTVEEVRNFLGSEKKESFFSISCPLIKLAEQ